MRNSRQAGRTLLSRRRLIGAVGSAAAIAGLPGCNSDPLEAPPTGAIKVIDGYTDKQSYRQGELVTLYINAETQQHGVINISDYAGNVVLSIPAHAFPQQPRGSSPWETGFGYKATVSFILPYLPSGVYLVDGLISLVVKNGAVAPPIAKDNENEAPNITEIIIVYPTNTIAAYNAAGGRSMYSAPTPAPIVSFQRPTGWTSNVAFSSGILDWFTKIPLPYRVGYIADIDLENYSEIADTKLLLIIGHSEYWTRRARENFDRFVLGGGNALMLSGNNMWWQVRYSDDQTQMICYKRAPDPISDPLLETVNWSQPQLEYPIIQSLGADFPRGGFGSNKTDSFRILAPQSPVFKNLFVQKGSLLGIPTVEYDGAPLLNNPVTSGDPQLDLAALGAYRAELIGYTYCSANESEASAPTRILDRVGTWIVYQRTETSGIIINGASTNWCSWRGVAGEDGFRVRRVVTNMIDILVNELSPFTS